MIQMDTVFDIIFIIISTALLSLCSVKMLHMYQLSSYRFKGVLSWLKASHYDYLLRYFAYAFFASGFTVLFNLCFPQENIHYFSYLIYVFFGLTFIVVSFSKKAKVPLAITPRMRRLIMLDTLMCLGLSVGGWALSLTPMQECGYAVLPLFIPIAAALSYAVTYPFERANARSFMRDAAEEIDRMKAEGLKVVGITGSYGKTTAKNILLAMLSTKYRVCATPKSFNTPLGICRTVNDVLADDDSVFLAEMGARRRGDIAELCSVAKPDIALITGVGCQHLETFGSLGAIADTKYELVEALCENGYAVFNGADAGAKELSLRFGGKKAVAGGDTDNEPRYYDVRCDEKGTSFKVSYGGAEIKVTTPLLGSHVPALITACMAVAAELDVPLCACARACEKLAPVEHRLELIKAGEKTIIDDSYNSNPAGAKIALGVLSLFDGKKIIVTPGMVELGSEEADANRDFGRQIAEVCDNAFLVGNRGKTIAAGALEGGMDEENVVLVKDLEEATKELSRISEKAVILFENDLPDNY